MQINFPKPRKNNARLVAPGPSFPSFGFHQEFSN